GRGSLYPRHSECSRAETYLSTEQADSQAPPRLSCAHGDQGRAQGSRAPSRQGPQAADVLTMSSARRALETLARRADFLRVAGHGTKWATAGLIMQACPRRVPQENAAPGAGGPGQAGASVSETQTIRVGFTASKKVGGAVQRNRARRRLRALAREVLANEAAPGYDYVLIARP